MDKIKEYLSLQEHKEVMKFTENRVLFEAVKKVLLEVLYTQGKLKEGEPANPSLNYAFNLISRRKAIGQGKVDLTNEQIGADLAAVWEGVNLVGAGFDELEKFKEGVTPNEPRGNPGR